MNRSFSRRSISICCLLLGIALNSKAGQDPRYSALTIPRELLKNANAVVREDDVEYRILSIKEAVTRKHLVITILNENALGLSRLYSFYDKDTRITDIDGTLYDAGGQTLRHVKNKDIKDMSAVDNISIMDDNRVKVHDFGYYTYPFTVEYNIETHSNSIFVIPAFRAAQTYHESVQSASYRIVAPPELMPAFKAFNFSEKPVQGSEKNLSALTWLIKDFKALPDFFAGPAFDELIPRVQFSAKKFDLNGYQGASDSWLSFGQFVQRLNEGRDQLPPELEARVKALVANAGSTREKVGLLYKFLQQNTHYISIQLGIGGFQPLLAREVASKGYGDCKALSNYMVSLLKAADIPALYTLVHAGDDDDDTQLVEDLPSSQFNHIIVCVPMQPDSLWLECTSQDTEPGYMGGFTGNRKALAITPEGGKLIATPRYGLSENGLTRQGLAKIDEEGGLRMSLVTKYTGTAGDDLHGIIHHASKDDVRKYLQRGISLSTFNIEGIEHVEDADLRQTIHQKFTIAGEGIYNTSGRRLFLEPLIIDREGRSLDLDSTRKVDFVFSDAYAEDQTLIYELPAGYTLEYAPADLSFISPMGDYQATITMEGNKLTYHRSYQHKPARLPASRIREVQDFFNKVYKADRVKVVLVKNE